MSDNVVDLKCFRITGRAHPEVARRYGSHRDIGKPIHQYFCATPGSFEIYRALGSEYPVEVPEGIPEGHAGYGPTTAVGLRRINPPGLLYYVYVYFDGHQISQVESFRPSEPNDTFLTVGGCEACACNTKTHCIVPCPGSPKGHCCLSHNFLKAYADFVKRLTTKDD